MSTSPAVNPSPSRWQRFSSAGLRGFHAYANWLVSISWKRFWLLAVLLLVGAAMLQSVPPFSWKTTEMIQDTREPSSDKRPLIKIEKPRKGSTGEGIEISIDERGVRITPKLAAPAAPSASTPVPTAPEAGGAAPSPPPSVTPPAAPTATRGPSIEIRLPPGANADAVHEAVREVREALHEATQAKDEALREAADARKEAERVLRERPRTRVRTSHLGAALPEMVMLFILMSIIVKITYKGRLQAEVKAAQATETATAEQLRRQLVEARMAAMQAQVEPHFLFNTLASIDHLIETDPARASVMQKNLIALLRASMPTLRETGNGGLRDLGHEMAVIRPYLAILKVRMEDRLHTEIDVAEGLHSASFPPLMLQTLVENAIKHGLEPKPEGGTLSVRAQVVHGALEVSVNDTGMGFNHADTAGTGVGLANIRERLQLLYGERASLTIAADDASGTRVTITVPYTVQRGAESAA